MTPEYLVFPMGIRKSAQNTYSRKFAFGKVMWKERSALPPHPEARGEVISCCKYLNDS